MKPPTNQISLDKKKRVIHMRMGRKSAQRKRLANASSNRWHQSTGRLIISYIHNMFIYIIKTVSTSGMADSSPPAPSFSASSICSTPTVTLSSSQCSAGSDISSPAPSSSDSSICSTPTATSTSSQCLASSEASSPTPELSSLDFSGLASNSGAAINESSNQGCWKCVKCCRHY